VKDSHWERCFHPDLVAGRHEEDDASEQQAQVGRLGQHPAGTHLHLGDHRGGRRGGVGQTSQRVGAQEERKSGHKKRREKMGEGG